MKIVMVGQIPEPGEQITGGVERVIATLVPELAKHVEIIVVSPGAKRDAIGLIDGVEVRYLRRSAGPGVLRYWSSDARRIRAEIIRINPDIVHIQGMAGWGLGLKRPAVFTIHGIVDRDLLTVQRTAKWAGPLRHLAAAFVRWIEDVAADQMQHIIVINPYVLDVLPQVKRNTLYQIPYPIFYARRQYYLPTLVEVVLSFSRI